MALRTHFLSDIRLPEIYRIVKKLEQDASIDPKGLLTDSSEREMGDFIAYCNSDLRENHATAVAVYRLVIANDFLEATKRLFNSNLFRPDEKEEGFRLAASNGSIKVVKALMKEAAISSDVKNRVLLTIAGGQGIAFDVFKILINDPAITNKDKREIFKKALEVKHINVIDALTEDEAITAETKVTIFCEAAEQNNLNALHSLREDPAISTALKVKVFSEAAKKEALGVMGVLRKDPAITAELKTQIFCEAVTSKRLLVIRFFKRDAAVPTKIKVEAFNGLEQRKVIDADTLAHWLKQLDIKDPA